MSDHASTRISSTLNTPTHSPQAFAAYGIAPVSPTFCPPDSGNATHESNIYPKLGQEPWSRVGRETSVRHDLAEFVNSKSNDQKNKILCKTLAGLQLLEIHSRQAGETVHYSINPVIESCDKLRLITSNQNFTSTRNHGSIWDAYQKLEHQAQSFTSEIFYSLQQALKFYSGEENLSDSAIKTALSNIIDNTPINKKSAPPKRHYEDYSKLKGAYVFCGDQICEIYLSLLEAIKYFAKSAKLLIASYATAEGRQKRALKNDFFNITREIYRINKPNLQPLSHSTASNMPNS